MFRQERGKPCVVASQEPREERVLREWLTMTQCEKTSRDVTKATCGPRTHWKGWRKNVRYASGAPTTKTPSRIFTGDEVGK